VKFIHTANADLTSFTHIAASRLTHSNQRHKSRSRIECLIPIDNLIVILWLKKIQYHWQTSVRFIG